MSEFFMKRYRAINKDVEVVTETRQALRLNTAKVTVDKLKKSLMGHGATLEKIPYLEHGYYFDASFSMGATIEYLLGWYYLQGPLSQLACEILNPAKDATVLDMAAAPGGKTTYLAAMAHEGVVIALDSNPIRLATVRNNVERLGLPNVVCVKKDARFVTDLKKKFTHILLDAPCSGNFCSEQGWFEKRTIDDVASNARVQKELIKAAYRCLAPGGRLLYSTCSLEPEEDELVVDFALKKFEDLRVVPLDCIGDAGLTQWENVTLDPSLAGTRRFWPHVTGCEGFFIALLEKK